MDLLYHSLVIGYLRKWKRRLTGRLGDGYERDEVMVVGLA
jgi:hypothetical protein